MRIAIVDYGSGNLRSCAQAFERAAPGSVKIAADPAALRTATHIVLPGVGAFGDCMRGLIAIPGMRDALVEEVRQKKKPFLGICVGMQMMMEKGYEHGKHAGLGWIKGEVVKIGNGGLGIGDWEKYAASNPQSPIPNPQSLLKIPHMGWNELQLKRKHPALRELREGDHAYFVHSYHVLCEEPLDVLATVDYGGSITAIIGRDNLLGTQFHPEKSQETGLKLIKGFLSL